MNERMKDLMNQTGVPVLMPFDKWCEKFAELIVRECTGFLRDDLDDHFAAEQLEEHFGVE